jgi:predicted dehydrogenase
MSDRTMKFLICGLGLIGKQRLQAVLDSNLAEEIYVYDPYLEVLPSNYDGLVRKIDYIPEPSEVTFTHVVIATPHHESLKVIERVISHKPRILMEKPMGRNFLESEKISQITSECDLSVGFNYRFMDGIVKLKEIVVGGELGAINSIRLDLGHGGAPDDANSWKLNKELAGGGSLLDPGIHLLDLIMYLFQGETDEISIDGVNYWSGFWNTGIEESSMVLGRVGHAPFSCISSIVAWRTRFVIEVIGTNGYAIVNGRGRSDGPQSITIGRRWGWKNAKSQIDSEEKSIVMLTDSSITNETNAWINNSQQVCSALEALESMKLYQEILSKKVLHEIQ